MSTADERFRIGYKFLPRSMIPEFKPYHPRLMK